MVSSCANFGIVAGSSGTWLVVGTPTACEVESASCVEGESHAAPYATRPSVLTVRNNRPPFIIILLLPIIVGDEIVLARSRRNSAQYRVRGEALTPWRSVNKCLLRLL